MKILSEMYLNADIILTPLSYNKISHNRDMKNKEFLSKKVIYNALLGTLQTIRYNKEWYLRQSYIYNTIKIDELNEQSIENDLVPIFITLTCPAEHHPSSIEYNPFISVKDSYEFLLDIFRNVYNNFKVNQSRIENMKFIRVIEPHKSFVPHLHAIIYVPASSVDNFRNHFNNQVKRYKLKQTDYKVLDTARYAVTYLLKYVQKTLEGDDVIRGWAIHHGLTRLFTMSNLNMGINREIFRKITKYVPFDKDSDLNYFRQILEKVSIKRVLTDVFREPLKVQYFGNSDANISVYLEVRRVKKFTPTQDNIECICYEYNEDSEQPTLSTITYDRELDCEFQFDYDDSEETSKYSYFLDELIINIDSIKKYDKKLITMQNKGDYYE